MTIVALDTSTRWMSAAIWTEEGLLREETVQLHRSMLARSAILVEAMLRDAGITLADVTAGAAGTGPGSYTGLRIGLSLMQGLAASRVIPLFGVASSMCIAAAIGGYSRVYVLQESGRRTGHAAASVYDTSAWPPLEVAGPRLIQPREFAEVWQGHGAAVGDAATRVVRACGAPDVALVTTPECHIPRASLLARLAAHRLHQGEMGNPWGVQGIYLAVPPFPRKQGVNGPR